MRRFLLALLLGSSLFVLADAPQAHAQSTQTDQSEEDWRKSQRKNDTSDIFEDILNNRTSGSGNGFGPPNPIESLPEESRRHLLKERAKIIATSEPGQVPDTPYTPSDAAIGDSDLQEQEKEAWEDIIEDLKGSGQGGPGGQGNQDGQDGNQGGSQDGSQGSQGGDQQSSQAGQSGGSPSAQGGGSQGGNGNSYNGPTPLRGGSSASVADILARIKGLQPQGGTGGGGSSPTGSPTGNGQSPFGQSQNGQGQGGTQGQSSQGQSGQGQSGQGQSAQGQSQQGQVQSDQGQQGQGQQGQLQNQPQSQSQGQSASQGQDQGAAQQASNGQQSGSQDAASGAAGAQDASSDALAQTQSQPESIGPLERIRNSRREGTGSGRETSASDFLKDISE